jgi:hypothetical protein
MITFQLKWTTVGLVSVAIVAATGALASGQIVDIVAPSSAANVEGNSGSTPGLTPLRIQHLIPASDFTNLPASNRRIVAFNFRADTTQTQVVDWTSGDEMVWMSTTNLNTLTTTYDNNHGADRTLVHNGPLPFHLLATGPAGGPRDFAPGPQLDKPFFYDPSKGNLLVDRLMFATNPSALATIDTQLTTLNLTVLGNPNSSTGILFMEVAVLRFEFVPEPGDFNHDGAIDAADYVVWRNGLGSIYTQADYDLWRTHFGQTAGSGAIGPLSRRSATVESSSTAVPEPTSQLLCILAPSSAIALATLQRRRVLC